MDRFSLELEFVQCLSNPLYLTYLAQKGYLGDKRFLNYCEYLKYFKKDKYSIYLQYPSCLEILDLISIPKFREEIKKTEVANFIHKQQYLLWKDVSLLEEINKS